MNPEIPRSRLPKCYVSASWRNTTAVDVATQSIGVGFNLASSEILHLKLDLESARHLAESLSEYLTHYGRAISQSDKSSGIPSVEVSMPEEGVNV